MENHYSWEIHNEVDCLRLNYKGNKLVEEADIGEVGGLLEERLNGEYCNVVALDLSDVAHLSSASLSVLLNVRKLANEINKRFVLINLSKQARDIFEVTNLYKIFEIYDSVEGVRGSMDL